MNPDSALEIYSTLFCFISSTYSHYEFQNSSLFFQSKTVRERLILLQNFVDQRFLLRNMGWTWNDEVEFSLFIISFFAKGGEASYHVARSTRAFRRRALPKLFLNYLELMCSTFLQFASILKCSLTRWLMSQMISLLALQST